MTINLLKLINHATNFLTCLLLLGAAAAIAQSPYDSPYQNGMQPQATASVGGSMGTDAASVKQWFQKYDAIRRQAQMKPDERRRADALLSKGLSMIVPGPEKADSQQLLTKLVSRYQVARHQLEGMPLLPATEQLHRGYYQYFTEAQKLFSDYLKVQDNLFAVDDLGKPIAGQLIDRKASLESLDMKNKSIDAELRQQFGIPNYQF